MPLGEFDVIARYFSRNSPRGDVLLGVGDDAALLTPAPGQALVVATDTLVEGRHFLAGTPCQLDPGPFTSDDWHERADAAKDCHPCPIRAPCDAAGADEPAHVWGGTDRTPTTRKTP